LTKPIHINALHAIYLQNGETKFSVVLTALVTKIPCGPKRAIFNSTHLVYTYTQKDDPV